jgi:hypothetical protein
VLLRHVGDGFFVGFADDPNHLLLLRVVRSCVLAESQLSSFGWSSFRQAGQIDP